VTPQSEPLVPLLAQLRILVPAGDVAAVDELVRRLDGRALRVLVAGEAKRGKSTLVNALLGRDLLPTGVVPLTAVVTSVRYGPAERLTVRFADGTTRCLPIGCLPGLVTEQGNPANARGVAEVTLTTPAALLAGGAELVDTPGVGSVHAHNTAEATAALDRMDAAIFVLSADPPISASERALLRRLRSQAVRVFCVLNKTDRLTGAELAEAAAFTRTVLAAEFGADTDADGDGDAGVVLYPLSARPAPDGRRDSGFTAFAVAFTDYLATAGPADLGRSVAGRGGSLARALAETQQATLATLALSGQDLDSRLNSFNQTLAEVGRRRIETAAIAAAAFDRLQADTDRQAAQLSQPSAGQLQEDAAARQSEAATGPAGDVETEALGVVASSVRRTVDGWLAARGGELDAELAALGERLTGELTGQVAAVRDSAARLFSLDLLVLPRAARLAPFRRFSYAFTPDPGQFDAMAAVLRRRLPGRWGRRQRARYLSEQSALLLDKHVGRARAAFQAQLSETRQGFTSELDRRFADGAGRIAEAVRAAAQLRAEQAPQVNAARHQAESVLEQARALTVRFDAAADREARVDAALA